MSENINEHLLLQAYQRGYMTGKAYTAMKKAYWRDCFRDVDTCSRCKHTVPKIEYGGKYPYCPHCGAKMDGENLG